MKALLQRVKSFLLKVFGVLLHFYACMMRLVVKIEKWCKIVGSLRIRIHKAEKDTTVEVSITIGFTKLIESQGGNNDIKFN